MRFVLISDIHADVHAWNWNYLDAIPHDVNTVVVAGDISNDVWDVSCWLVELRQRFVNVIWVAGNHDFYNLGFHKTRIIPSREWAEKWKNPLTVLDMLDHYQRWSQENGIHFLHRNSIDIDGVTFVGATGWHDYKAGIPYPEHEQIQVWYDLLNDRHIPWQDNRVIDHRFPFDAGVRDVAAIQQMVSNATNPVVVITHHVPRQELCWQKPHDKAWTLLHGSFANTKMSTIVDPKIRYWVYGHTHMRSIKDIDGITFVCNARGYRYENESWEPVVLEV